MEKLLKAHVAEVTQTLPIKIHDLIYLVKKSELELPERHLDFVGKINTASIPTRYPDDLQRALKEYQKSVANLTMSHFKTFTTKSTKGHKGEQNAKNQGFLRVTSCPLWFRSSVSVLM